MDSMAIVDDVYPWLVFLHVFGVFVFLLARTACPQPWVSVFGRSGLPRECGRSWTFPPRRTPS